MIRDDPVLAGKEPLLKRAYLLLFTGTAVVALVIALVVPL